MAVVANQAVAFDKSMLTACPHLGDVLRPNRSRLTDNSSVMAFGGSDPHTEMPRANIDDGENSFDASHRKRQSTPRRIYASRRLPAWWLSMFSLVLRGDKHRRIKRSGVASEFAVHPAGEIDASDQVLSKSVVHAAQSDSLVAESKRS
jgi:hypothetical protein